MIESRQLSSTTYPVMFFLPLSIDHITGATGKAPTVTISKNGGAFGAAAGAVSEVGNGWYALAGNATDRNTLGECALHGTAPGCDPKDFKINIVGCDPFDQYWGIPGFSSLQTIVSGSNTFVNPLNASATVMSITAGDDYLNTDGRAFSFTVSGFPSLTGATITFTAAKSDGTTFTKTGTVLSATSCRLDLARTDTAALSTSNNLKFNVRAALSGSGDIITLASGTLLVLNL